MTSYLICSTPVHGHVTPLLAVSRHLVARGHRVRFLTGARYRDAVTATGAEHLQLPAEADYDDTNMDAAFPGRVGKSGVPGIRWDISNIFLKPAPAQIRAVDEAVLAEPTDAILVESMFIGSMGLLARPRAERPAIVSLGIIPLGLGSVDTAPFGLGILPKPGLAGRLRNAALRVVTEKFIFGGLQKEAAAMILATTGRPLDVFFMSGASQADAIVQFTVADFEYPRRELPETVHFVGPVSRTTPSVTPLPAWWGELDGSRPVVHVSQGTVANKDYEELIAPAMRGLAGEDVLVLVSTGGRPVESLPQPLPANVRAAEYLPYDALLPLTDVFVSNGGYGGVHYALEHGVPLVVAGTTEDKLEVNARVEWAGVGVNLRSHKPAPDAVAAAVRTVLVDPGYAARSRAIGAQITASSGLAGLEEVVQTLTAQAAVRR
ncbi:glycosyltransferase [Microterricola viridarii]|uniref:Glycosyltransferase, MGT family n=1 Tax=Microterricola viridarii TaxID=412690 RepID=A0A1H1N0T6_9MICO|nr:nucleotide disphospho-sugar-binding domain-containing protein [Microterricola viridarii]SDR92468.1 glycosyltransferase, MGT family [Microterricola viridarii]